jgi:hypothetical protein
MDEEIFAEGKNWEAELRKAIVESDAFVMIVDPSQPVSPNSTFELGAAIALHKPVFVVQANDKNGTVPGFLQHYTIFPLTEIDHLAESIKEVCEPLSPDERAALIAVYQETGLPSDRLLSDPLAIEELSDRFRETTGRRVLTKHLVSELLRLRKAGELPRIRASKSRS